MAEPLLKWAGGKSWLTSLLAPVVAQSPGRYFEPFCGGAALFFAALPRNASLSDVNADLIETYRAVAEDVQTVAAWLRCWPNTRDFYYRLRGSDFSHPAKRAARIIYLNKTCWSGLYRVNRLGKFNTPYAGYVGRSVYSLEHLLQTSFALGNTELIVGDFEAVLDAAKYSDFIYLDPPYASRSGNSGFLRYSPQVFSWEDQKRLATVAVELAQKGCSVVVSNANTREVSDLYPGFQTTTLSRRSTLAGNGTSRMSHELLLMTGDVMKHLGNIIVAEKAG